MAKKQNNLEWEITKGLHENKGVYTEPVFYTHIYDHDI